MNRLNLLLSLLFLSIASLSQAQMKPVELTEFMKEIETLNRVMSSPRKLQVDIHQEIKNQSSGEVVYTGTGFFIRKDSNQLHSRVMGVETIQNSDMKVVIDSSSQTIVVSKNSGLTPINDLKYMYAVLPKIKGLEVFGGMDSLKRKVYMVIYPENSLTKVKTLKVTISNSGYLDELQIGASAVIEQKTVLVTNTIVYSNYRINKRIGNKEFNTSEFVSVRDNRVELKGSYGSFQLVNMLNQ